MDDPQDFAQAAGHVVSRHRDTGLASRWEEAREMEFDVVPDGFWIRESDDVVNIVWLTRRGINDIAWIPGRQMSTYNFLRLSGIIGVEVRDAPDAAQALGVSVSGNLVVLVRATGDRAGLVWVAADEAENVDRLRAFARLVLSKIPEG